MDSESGSEQPWFLRSSYPVYFPPHEALTKSQADFEAFVRDDLARKTAPATLASYPIMPMTDDAQSDTFTLVSDSTSAEIRQGITEMKVDEPVHQQQAQTQAAAPSHPFMQALLTDAGEEENPRSLEGMMRTENGDLAFRSSNDALVDLFQELEDSVTGPRLTELLERAWAADSLGTLKIIFNARSIHLGKSSKNAFYRCAGWLAQHHPLTLVSNLRWLSRPVIDKKAKKDETDGDIIILDEKDENDVTRFDVKNGVAHGYWKDLLNILVLAVNTHLSATSNPRHILNSENPGIRRGKSVQKLRKLAGRRGGRGRGGMTRGRGGSRAGAGRDDATDKIKPVKAQIDHKSVRRQTRDKRHDTATQTFDLNPVYRVLHLTIARLFAEQLDGDLRALHGDDPTARRNISLCGKWAPSHDHFHDKHTFIVSSIAEILFPRDSFTDLDPTDDREKYLRFAREKYRTEISALRKHLDIVERNITANTYDKIKYDRVPSIAMNNYSKLFIEKDMARFEEYIDKVAQGKARISGATLLPSTIVHKAASVIELPLTEEQKLRMTSHEIIGCKVSEIEMKVLDGQWNALVQRIKDSGTLDNCIAVCDVSGSMASPWFHDKTCPMDSAIGLSLLIAEVAKPPFGGSFITFSADPEVVSIDLTASVSSKVHSLRRAHWGMNTDFVAVFEKLILPVAIKNDLKKEDMVKRIFVFSDMQFDEANQEPYHYRQSRTSNWYTSYERVQSAFQQAGYDMPELVFWNLAGGSANSFTDKEPIAPKPVTAAEEGTCLVSGYSQGMLKVFLDNGSFEDPEQEEDEVVISLEGDEVVEEKTKSKMNPIAVVKKAISHKAYDMLEVMD